MFTISRASNLIGIRFFVLSLGLFLVGFAHASLPVLDHDDWEDCFVVYESQRYDLSVGVDGEVLLIPKQRDKDHVAIANRIRFDYGIEEVHPNGKTVLKEIDEDSLVSEQEATDNLERVVIQGQATGDSKFELVIEESRGVISMSGRVLDAGKLTTYPLRFTVRAKIPNVYTRPANDDKKALRDFEKVVRRDSLEIERVDGSRVKVSLDETPDIECEELNGAGIEEAEIGISYYENRKFYFVASKGSSMHLVNDEQREPMYQGFSVNWVRSAADGDPEGKARLQLWVK